MTIDLENVVLDSGEHSSPEAGMCVMEMASYIAREPWSDHPVCVSPVLGAFLRSWNDALDDQDRQLLKPYAAKVIGTNDGQDEKRAWMCVDWLARTYLPAWLDLAGLNEYAAKIRALAVIESSDTAEAAQPTLDAAGDAAWDAALDAAWAAARDAAWAKLAATVKVLQASAFELLDRLTEIHERKDDC